MLTYPEEKQISALFTVVWADNVELNKSYPIDIPGAGVYNLTRIVPDEDPTGFTKWGVQDTNDPNYINWYIRVNNMLILMKAFRFKIQSLKGKY